MNLGKLLKQKLNEENLERKKVFEEDDLKIQEAVNRLMLEEFDEGEE